MTPGDRARVLAILTTIGLGSALHAPPAHAQSARSAQAEALFREGRALIKQNKVAAGCDKLAASERLDSSVGTLLNLGDCQEKLGLHASAWAAFRKAEAMAKRAGDDEEREREARRRAAGLEPRLAKIVIEVAPAHRIEGLVIEREGTAVDPGTWSSAVPIDPGTYEIVAAAPGHRPWRAEITIAPKSKRWVVVPRLERAPVVRAPPPVAQPVASPRAPTVVRRSPRGAWTTTRKVSLVLAVTGAGALGGGLYFGMRAQDLQDDADVRCPLTICADAEGLRLNREAQDAALRANVGYIAGGAALAVAAVMWFVGAPDDEVVVVPAVGGGGAGVSLAGSF